MPATQTRTALATATPLPTPTPGPEALAAEAIQELLEERARVILAGDKDAFMATVSQGDREFHSLEERLFDNLQSLPLASLEFIFERPGLNVDTRRQDWKWEFASVHWRYSWEGMEDEIHTYSQDYHFGQEEGIWKAIGSAEIAPNNDWWLRAPLFHRYTDHFLIVYHYDIQSLVNQVGEILEAGYVQMGASISSAAGIQPRPLYLVWLASDGLPFGASEFFKLTGSVAPIVGVAQANRKLESGQFVVESRIIYLNGGALSEVGPNALRTAVNHELVHAILDTVTMPFTPIWLIEGAALYLTEEEIDFERIVEGYEGLAEPWLDLEFITDRTAQASGGPPDILAPAVYSYWNAATTFLIQEFGEDTYWDLYLSYGQVSSEEILAEVNATRFFSAAMNTLAIRWTDMYVRDFLGMSEAELDEAVKAWIDEQLAS